MMRRAVEGESDRVSRRGTKVRILYACGCEDRQGWVRATDEAAVVLAVQTEAAKVCPRCQRDGREAEHAARPADERREQARKDVGLWE